MGCGKTTLGREIASSLGFEFVDTDGLVVERAGRRIPDIFAKEGESGFREFESDVLRSIAGRENMVVATGGGIILRPENRALLSGMGLVVWLDASEDAIFDRISRNEDRPLLATENPRETIARLLAERRPLYEETASLAINTDHLDGGEIIHGIIESAQEFFSRSST